MSADATRCLLFKQEERAEPHVKRQRAGLQASQVTGRDLGWLAHGKS